MFNSVNLKNTTIIKIHIIFMKKINYSQYLSEFIGFMLVGGSTITVYRCEMFMVRNFQLTIMRYLA